MKEGEKKSQHGTRRKEATRGERRRWRGNTHTRARTHTAERKEQRIKVIKYAKKGGAGGNAIYRRRGWQKWLLRDQLTELSI